MGVDRYDYLVLGWKMKKDIFNTDFFCDLADHSDMAFYPKYSEFFVYGKLLKYSEQHVGFGFDTIETHETKMSKEDRQYLTKIFEEVSREKMSDWVEYKKPKMFIFSMEF